MTQKVKAFAAKIEDLSSISRIHVVEGKNRLPKAVLQSLNLSPPTSEINTSKFKKEELAVILIPEPILGNFW